MTDPENISIDAYDYPLPHERIATHPLAERDRCKLLVTQEGEEFADHVFTDLPRLLPAESVLVYNNTKVINARLKFAKPTGGLIEIFCLEPHRPADYEQNFASTGRCEWLCLIGNAKRWKEGPLTMPLKINGTDCELQATKVATHQTGWIVRFDWTGPYTFSDIISAAGRIPIPPYLNRDTEESDYADYQTVYSHIEGSVAAPTAGLHFTPGVLAAIDQAGIPRREVTLHVGAGTFQPVKSETIGAHPMHSEFIAVKRALITELAGYLADKKKIIAVGTTSVRTLESLYHIGCLISRAEWQGEVPQWYPYAPTHPRLEPEEALRAVSEYLTAGGADTLLAATRIIIAPGYDYQIVTGMVTNFHQPRSTLLLLVSAFMGERWREMYSHALRADYRFLSYGDACLLLR